MRKIKEIRAIERNGINNNVSEYDVEKDGRFIFWNFFCLIYIIRLSSKMACQVRLVN